MASKRQIQAELAAKHAVGARERADREKRNLVDMAEFLTQRSREEAVGVWLEAAVRRLELEAGRRRARCRAAAGAAVAAMVDRGASVRDIAGVVGLQQSSVQEYLKAAQRPPVNGVAVGSEGSREPVGG
jgi:hypothetical protein